jgi:hypothetical protein
MEILIIMLFVINMWANNINFGIVVRNQAFILKKIEELQKQIKQLNNGH